MHYRILTTSITLLVALSPNAVDAQMIYGQAVTTEATDSTRHARCLEAVDVLTNGGTSAQITWAQELLGGCELTGGPQLAKLWTSQSADVDGLEMLIANSRKVRDGRVLDSVVLALGQYSRPVAVRKGALEVLVSYAVPTVAYPSLVDSSFRLSSKDGGREGSVPLPTDVVARVNSALTTSSTADPDASVRDLAHRMLVALQAAVNGANMIVDPAKLSVLYVCGNKFTVRNANRVAVILTYSVDGTPQQSLELRVSGARPGQSYAEEQLLTQNPGTVRLYYLESQVSSAANAATTCSP